MGLLLGEFGASFTAFFFFFSLFKKNNFTCPVVKTSVFKDVTHWNGLSIGAISIATFPCRRINIRAPNI